MLSRLRPLAATQAAFTTTSCRQTRAFWSLFSTPEPTQQPELDLDHIDFTEQEEPKNYRDIESLQEHLRDEFLSYKAKVQQLGFPRPRPKLITFESTPTITLGRRQEPPTGEPERSRLLRPVDICLTERASPLEHQYDVQCVKSSRGGLTTYHGPGQLVCWPVLDMTSPQYPRYSVSSYATHLESVTQRLLHDLYGIETFTSAEDPGVWVRSMSGQPFKIAALGVHHRRYITSYGIAINIDMAVKGGEDKNVWSRFVPCGLEGKGVTSVEDQVGPERLGQVDMSQIAQYWASTFKEGLLDPTKRVWNSSPREAGAAQSSIMQDTPMVAAGTLAAHSALSSQLHDQQGGETAPGEAEPHENAQEQQTPKDEPFDPDDFGGDDFGGGDDFF